MKKAILVNLFPPNLEKSQAIEDATEMYNLIDSLGSIQVVDMIHQRGYPAKSAYIGTGKAQEVGEKIVALDADIVVLNGYAKSRQLFELWTILQPIKHTIEVWDRIDLILTIFSTHAKTAEAKLQIELARMRHMGPRIYGMGHVLSQQGGGIGTRGIGETNVELMKRHWKDAMRLKKKELTKLSNQRISQIMKRKETGKSTLSIIGYTNAGKTTLFNRLTKKEKFADNLLFATLDSAIGSVYLPGRREEVFLSDTIGFVRSLPPSLIEAFKSTLLESIHADILLHVVDGANPAVFDQFHVVEQIISELGLLDKDEIVIVNKIDTATRQQLELIKKRLVLAHPVFVSAASGTGIDALLQTIELHLAELSTPSTPGKTVRIHSRDIDQEVTHEPFMVGRRRNERLKRADWRQDEAKDVISRGDDWSTRDRVVTKVVLKNPNRDELHIGQEVVVVEKSNQKTGATTQGVVQKILSHSFSHPHGIKVELTTGVVGRVKLIVPS